MDSGQLTVYIIRGCSGSGKSTFSNTLKKALNGLSVEADDFMYEWGQYNWHPDKLKPAHRAVLRQLREWMELGFGPLIISDTNVKAKDLQIYLDLAVEFNYRVVSLVVENRHGNKSVHDVCEKTMKRQESQLRQSLKLRG